MNTHRSPWSVVAAVLLTALCGGCTTPEHQATVLETLLDSEREFSAASQTDGMKAAFLRYLHDEAILFRPHPVNGKRYLSDRPESAIQLSWKPIRAGVARSGELGWTTGPYVVAPLDEGGPPLEGYFVSVWRLRDDGLWKVVVDLGTVNPPDDSCPDESEQWPAEIASSSGSGGGESDDPRGELLDLERRLSERSTAAGIATVYGDVLEVDARLYRDGRCPATDPSAVQDLLADTPGPMGWEPIDATVSDSGDLAYTYGSYFLATEAPPHDLLGKGYYVRVWRRSDAGEWRLVLEVTSPVPAEEDPTRE
jgi:ketosteroid isomerase-like protein